MDGFRQFVSWLFWVFEWLALVVMSCVCYAHGVDLSQASRHVLLEDQVRFVKNFPTETGIALGVFILVVRMVRYASRTRTEERQVIDRLINEALNRFRKAAFPTLPPNRPDDENRVTVFEWRQSHWSLRLDRWPWSGWLVPICRSGHVTKERIAVFSAPDDPAKIEGVAGEAWRRGACRVGKEDVRLPDLTDVGYSNVIQYWLAWLMDGERVRQLQESDNAVAKYAEMTYCSAGFVWGRIKKGKPNPSSIVGIRLEDRHQQPWGVVVIDSCNASECMDTEHKTFRGALTTLTNELKSLNVIRG